MDSRKEFLFLLTLAAVQFTNIVDFMIVMPLGPGLMRVFDITPTQFSLIVSSYSFAAGISGFLSSFFVDRMDRKNALRFFYFGFLVATILCGVVTSYEAMITARLLTGVFGGVLGGLTYSMVGDAIPPERRGRAMGIVMTSFSFASVVGVPLGLALATAWEWHAPFFFLGVVGIFIFALIQRVVPPMRDHIVQVKDSEDHPIQRIFDLLKKRPVQLGMAISVFLIISNFIIIPFISPSMVANVKFTESQLVYIYLFGGAATIVTSPLIGRIVDKIGAIPVFTVALIANLIPVYFITHMEPSPLIWALSITTLFFVTANSRMVPYMALVTSQVAAQNRGAFMALNSCLQQLASSAAALVGGIIIVKDETGRLNNYGYTFYVALVASALLLLMIRLLPKNQKAN